MSKVLVTGGAGFVGSNLVKELIDRKNKVAVVDNLFVGSRQLLPLNDPDLTLAEIDIRDQNKLFEFMRQFGPEVVIHLAAIHYIPYCNENPVETTEVNLIGTRNVFKCCEIVRPEVVFFASTAAVYSLNDKANSESLKPGPIDIYGFTKLCAEDISELFYRETRIRTVVGRYFNIYGLNETNPHLIPEIVKQLINGKHHLKLGNLMPKRDFINVKDVVNATLSLVDKFKDGFGVFNIGTGKEYSVLDIVHCFEKITGEKIRVIRSIARVRKTERQHLLAKITKINKEIGWYPKIRIGDGLEELFLAEFKKKKT